MWDIISKRKSVTVKDKYIFSVRCSECKQLFEFICKDEDELNKLGCAVCLKVEPVKKVKSAPDIVMDTSNEKHSDYERNIEYRLYRYWKRLSNLGKLCPEWTNSYELFKQWSLENGYKHWFELKRHNEKIKYRPSNCYWGASEKIFENLSENTSKKSVTIRTISNCYARSNRIRSEIETLEKEIKSLNNASYMSDKAIVRKLKDNCESLKKRMDKLLLNLNDIDLDSD